jgi:hypothetical protein
MEMEATGILAAGETMIAMAYVKGRRGVSPRQIKLILLVCMLAIGIPVGAWASGSWVAALISVEFAFIGFAVGLLLVQRLTGPAMRKALVTRGQAYEQPLSLQLTTDALVYNLGDVATTASWRCVTDLFETKRYWVFLVQSSAMILPRRFFVTPEDERNFIAEAMSRMPEAARARSSSAAQAIGINA